MRNMIVSSILIKSAIDRKTVLHRVSLFDYASYLIYSDKKNRKNANCKNQLGFFRFRFCADGTHICNTYPTRCVISREA